MGITTNAIRDEGDPSVLTDLSFDELTLLLGRAFDFRLVIDGEGRIFDSAVTNNEASDLSPGNWNNREWISTIAPENRQQAKQALQTAHNQPGIPVDLDVIHISDSGIEMPAKYVLLGHGSRTIGFADDLRPQANLRQQLLNSQQALEQDYWTLRQVETRYRQLLEMTEEALLIIDAGSGRVVEANAAANRLLAGGAANSLVGRPFPRGLAPESQVALERLFNDVRQTGRHEPLEIMLASGGERLGLEAKAVSEGNDLRFHVRITPQEGAAANDDLNALPAWLDRAPDGALLLDNEGNIKAANQAFTRLVEATTSAEITGRHASQWLGRTSVDLNVLLNNLRSQDSVRLYSSVLRGTFGAMTDVEISASTMVKGPEPDYLLLVRDVSRRVGAEHPSSSPLPRSIEQITRRVGQVPLKQLTKESTGIIEALCIDAALKLTGDNRASAAEILGLSRQSLYAKLHRYGVGTKETSEES
ncbi:transcriptional regulator PpsR [Luminiphilus syltensis NOR5-1B]|uniref:Transcriptional regulator PpsR n=1 Tax=Luminiphilus syltensis NOR5-1B TaxID=565045 RepID=B8KT42_9GAMM|nr:transcriptional regulator PpsR [Luminiphilus syltensis]EED34431.1 transcriptional regulator PpsR [Luminiphilus syltensis NOR5-1B]